MRFIAVGLGNWYSMWETVKRAVIEADRLGFFGFALPDHFLWGEEAVRWEGFVEGFDATIDSWTAIAYLSGITDRLRLGTLVTPLTLRPPAILAKIVTTVDLLSKGRVFLGVGAGWSRREFEMYAEWDEPRVRVEKTAEAVRLITMLWTMSKIDFDGKYYKIHNGVFEPKPIQRPYPLLLFGGVGRRMLELAGLHADICFIPQWINMDFRRAREIVDSVAAKASRRDKLTYAGGRTSPPSNRFNESAYLQDIEQALHNGCKYYMAAFPRNTYIDSMKRFAFEIMPSYVD